MNDTLRKQIVTDYVGKIVLWQGVEWQVLGWCRMDCRWPTEFGAALKAVGKPDTARIPFSAFWLLIDHASSHPDIKYTPRMRRITRE